MTDSEKLDLILSNMQYIPGIRWRKRGYGLPLASDAWQGTGQAACPGKGCVPRIFAFNKHLSPIETNELLMELKMDLMEI